MSRKNVLAICGSTRDRSTNLHIIKAIAELSAGRLNIRIFDGLSRLPHFNPDLDTDAPPAEVTEFRDQLRVADGVLICTPEYAMGLPGSLKNVLDWTVSSSGFSNKPVAAITASTSGQKAHESLLGTLKVIEARVDDDMQLSIPFANAKMEKDGKIADPETLEKVERLIDAFVRVMNETI
jgi:chromate reductase, NAD(P)H dehydrogenase (quinone)